MTTVIIEGKAEFVKAGIDAIILAGKTIHFITKLEAGKVLVIHTT